MSSLGFRCRVVTITAGAMLLTLAPKRRAQSHAIYLLPNGKSPIPQRWGNPKDS
jgi:hypothetical protein